jgi:tetrahydromethanopterin:alpha-L-glutamate ligase
LTDQPLRIGVVGIPGKWSSETLADTVAEKTGTRLLIDMAEVRVSLPDGQVLSGAADLTQLDALIIKKIDEIYSPAVLDRLELLRLIGARGVRLFSNPDQIIRLINRLSCTATLQAGGCPVPQTVITENTDAAAEAIESFGRAVLKPLYSTKARGMVVIDTDEAAWRDKLNTFANDHSMIYAQKLLDIPGQDLGVMFIGGRYLATYARVGRQGSWNTTIHSGGHYRAHDPSPAVLEIARQAQSLFDLDFTCVDVAETSDGPKVFEVSAFGGFRGLRDAHGIDAASLYTDHVITTLASPRKDVA